MTMALKINEKNDSTKYDWFVDSFNNHLWYFEDNSDILDSFSNTNLNDSPESNFKYEESKLRALTEDEIKLSSKKCFCKCNRFNVLAKNVDKTQWYPITYFTNDHLNSMSNQLNIYKPNSNSNVIKLNNDSEDVDIVYDFYRAKLNAVKLVFNGICQLLRVGYCIFDR